MWGEGSRGVFFSFFLLLFFLLSPCLLVLRVIIHPGPFQMSNATKGNPASSLPCPHPRLSLQQKQPLLGRVIISQGSFFIPQVRNALLLCIKATSHECWETRDGAADALPWVMLPMGSCQPDKLGSYRHSECFLFLQAGF